MIALKKFLHGFLDVLAAILLLVSLLVTCLAHGIFDLQSAERAICSQVFYDRLKSDIVMGMESFGGVFDISGDEVLNAVGEDNVKEYARKYTVGFFSAMYDSGEFNPPEFDDGNLKEYVYNYIRAFEPEMEEKELQEIYETVRKNVEGTVKYIPGIFQSIIPNVNKLVNSVGFIYDIEIYLYILFALAVGINIVLSEEKKRLQTLYGLLGTVFCVLATVVIPLIMIVIYDIPSKLVLDESVLLQFISGINRLVFVNTTVIIGIAFAIVTVLLTVVSILIAIKKYKENFKKTVDKIS